jgi:hypothetical protein
MCKYPICMAEKYVPNITSTNQHHRHHWDHLARCIYLFITLCMLAIDATYPKKKKNGKKNKSNTLL